MRITDQRYERDTRRMELAWRMVQQGVRRGTVVAWTGLTNYRVRALAHSYNDQGRYTRPRGPTPAGVPFFTRSVPHECQSAALAAMALRMDILPGTRVLSVKEFADLARGERVVKAFDLYYASVADPKFNLELTILLMTELALGIRLELRCCAVCTGVMVVDRWGTPHTTCGFHRVRRSRTPGQGPHARPLKVETLPFVDQAVSDEIPVPTLLSIAG